MQRPSQLEVLAPEWVNLPQLNAARTGTRVLFATDEWFAEAGNLNREEPPTFDEDAFDTHGKVLLPPISLRLEPRSVPPSLCPDPPTHARRRRVLGLCPEIRRRLSRDVLTPLCPTPSRSWTDGSLAESAPPGMTGA